MLRIGSEVLARLAIGACRWELVKEPDRAATPTGVNRRRIVIPSGRRSADPEPSQSKRPGA
jgi:hypothetical protein